MGLLAWLADNSDDQSLAVRLRRRRFKLFRELFESLQQPIRILDVGGTARFWQQMGFLNEPGVEITILNNQPTELIAANTPQDTKFRFHLGDALAMPEFKDAEFDVVFSNSVIEHVGDSSNQQQMAREIARVGKRYFVQTPNYYFPIEPHFLVPLFQFMPLSWRVWLLQRFNLGWTERIIDRNLAESVVGSVKLLTKQELQTLFPQARIYHERFWGMTKSFIVCDGWDP